MPPDEVLAAEAWPALGGTPILFFDGVCALCNASVDAVLRADRRRQIRFAPIQGETAKRLLPPLPGDPEEWSLVYVDERGVHRKSDAAIELARRLGGPWSVLGLLRFVPRALRDPAYMLVARNRYRWFGKRDSCRVPTEAERGRFLP